MNAPRSVFALASLLASVALADDRAACAAGDREACARIGQLKMQGALKADGTKDVDALITSCSKALTGAASLSQLSRACSQLFNPELQKSWSALSAAGGIPGLDALYGTAWAEAYCPKLSAKVPGCDGKRAANISALSGGTTPRAALKALNKAALELEFGVEKAAPLVAKFDAAWDKLLGR